MSLGIPPQNPNLAGSQEAIGCHVGPSVRLSVTHGLKQYDVAVPPQISIGNVSVILILIIHPSDLFILFFLLWLNLDVEG